VIIIEELTDRQLEILRFIAREVEVDGFPPTIREIGDELGINSTNGVADHLKALVRKGYLERRPRARARGLKLTRGGLERIAYPGQLCPTCHQPIRRAA
jgi:repressor LexA